MEPSFLPGSTPTTTTFGRLLQALRFGTRGITCSRTATRPTPFGLVFVALLAVAACDASGDGTHPQLNPSLNKLVPVDSAPFLAPSTTAHHAYSIGEYLYSNQRLVGAAIGILAMLVIIHMQPAVGAGGGSGMRNPPSWGPEMESRYPFRHWSRDVMVWSVLNSDLDSRRKCAAVILQLRGGAQELVRGLPPHAILQGGLINDVAVDPMTFLMHSLSERYSQLGEETRLEAITDIMNFRREGNERIDTLITRFDIVRQRANQQGALALPIQGLVWLLLRACGVDDTQLMSLLQPFGGLFPRDAPQYAQLCILLRAPLGHTVVLPG